MIKKFAYLFYILFSLVLLSILFHKIDSRSFLFIHDEYLILNQTEAFNIFFSQNPLSLGIPNTIVFFVTLFDRLYYILSYNLGFNLPVIQRALYLLKFIILMLIPYLGFLKLSNMFFKKTNYLQVFAISLWYSFNTFTLLYFHGNAFSLTILITYVLAPLTFYYFHKSIFNDHKYTDLFIASLLIFFMSFGIYLFAPFLIFLALYTLLNFIVNKINYKKILINLLHMSIIYLPLISFQILIPYDMFLSPTNSLNVTGGETFTNLLGGFLYPLFMWFSWGFYTEWGPRNIFNFSSYLETIPSVIAPFILYFLILISFIKNKKDEFILIILTIFIFFLFIIKGSQEPFGEIYTFLLDNFAPFRVFRSPESKIGFILVFLVSLMLIKVSQTYKNRLFSLLILIVTTIQGFLIFNGTAILGENTTISSDRIVTIPDEYFKLAEHINMNNFPYGYVMSIPSVEFGHYRIEDDKQYIGQDILPKLSSLPFLYLSENTSIYALSYNKLITNISQYNNDEFNKFPIRYIVARRDTKFSKNDQEFIDNISENNKKVFEDKKFTLYDNPEFSPLIHSENISFRMINPIKYSISFKNLDKNQVLFFNQSFDENWILIPSNSEGNLDCAKFYSHKKFKTKECSTEKSIFEFSELSYVFSKPLFNDSHSPNNDYANKWTVSPSIIKNNLDKKYYTLNADGSIDINLILYFKKQSILYSGAIITMIYISGSIIYILFRKNKLLNKK